ncbi:MAG: transposase [Kiritimatiellales bacterium]|nr:transposase [Kiritimatiellales bacterium]
MEEFESSLVEVLSSEGCALHAWCVLPNHWHALVRLDDLKATLVQIGRLHGRTSFIWNGEEGLRGRKCWHRCVDRRIRSDRHFYVARNYIHHNPVKHGYVGKWEDWPFSSVGDFIAETGREAVLKHWREYPVLDMGDGRDD